MSDLVASALELVAILLIAAAVLVAWWAVCPAAGLGSAALVLLAASWVLTRGGG